MTQGDELAVTISGKDVSLAAILRKIDAEMQSSANNAVKLGQSYARLANAQGQPAAAGQILAGTLQRAGAASEQAIIGIETQAARLATGSTAFQQFGQSAASSLASIAGPAALATTAIGGLIAVGQSFGDAFQFKAQLDATTASVKSQLDGFRDVNATYSEAAQFGRQFNLTQAETNSILQSSVGSLRTSAASVTQLETALLRLQSKDVSKPISEAARALAELESGDVTSIKELFRVSAKDALSMRDAIVAGGDSVQVLTTYLDRTQTGMDALKLRAQGVQGAFNELKVANEDLALAQAAFAQGPGLALLQERIALTSGATRILSGDFAAMGQSLQGVGAEFLANIARQHAWNDALLEGKTRAEAAAAGEAAHAASLNAGAIAAANAANADAAWNAALIQTGTVITGVTDIEQQRLTVLNAAASLSQQATSAALGYADSLALTGVQANAAAQAAQQKANTDQLASVAAQTHAVAQNALAQQAQIAAQALLASGGSGASAAALLAGSSSQVDVLTAAYYRLAQAQAAAGQAATKAKLDKQTPRQLIGADSESSDLRRGNRAELNADRDARIKAAHDAAEAERGYQQTLGNTAPALSHARAELAQLTAGSAAYINKQNEIAGLEKKGTKGGGGGGAKLSDQQKLNNALLADQESFGNKYEDAELDHRKKLLDINTDFYAKMRAADRDFNQAQLEGRAGFYDALGSIESPKIAQAASAAYEAASIEAGKIAQTQGADVAEKYMSAQEQIISARAKRLGDIEKAEKDKDKGKADYLKGVDAEYKKAEDAKLARIKEGEGSIAAEKQKQLDSEALSFEEKQGQIADSADRAAEKKILASTRASSQVDAEKLKVDGLAASYDALGAAGTRAGITPAAGTAPFVPGTSPAAPTATPAAPEDNPALAALESIRAAVDAAAAAIVGATRDTTRAVGRIGNNGGLAG